ncbi:MAG: hypothetical protein Q9196_001621 [Gyalolechia fulgens]
MKGKGKEKPDSSPNDGQTRPSSEKLTIDSPPQDSYPQASIANTTEHVPPIDTSRMTPKSPTRIKRRLDEIAEDSSDQADSSPEKAKEQHHVRSDGVSAPPSNPTSKTASAPRHRAKSISKTPHSARWGIVGCDKVGQSAPASFKAIHIPDGSNHAPAPRRQCSIPQSSKQGAHREQPMREAKIVRSIEHDVDPLNPTHTPYPWDDPLVSDANPFRSLSISDGRRVHDGSPPHERDTAFTPTSSTRGSDTEGSPLEKRRKGQKKIQAIQKPAGTVRQPPDPAYSQERHHRPCSPVARMERELTAALDLTSLRLNSTQMPGDSDHILPGKSAEDHGAEVRRLRKEVAHLTQLLSERIIVSEAKQRDQDLWFQRATDLLDRFNSARSSESREGSNLSSLPCSTLLTTSTAPDTNFRAIQHPPGRSNTEYPDDNTIISAWHPQSFRNATIDIGGASDRPRIPGNVNNPKARGDADQGFAKRQQPVPSQDNFQAPMDRRSSAPARGPIHPHYQPEDIRVLETPHKNIHSRVKRTVLDSDRASPFLFAHTRWHRYPEDDNQADTAVSPAQSSQQNMSRGLANLASRVPREKAQPPERRSRSPDNIHPRAAAEDPNSDTTSTVVVRAVSRGFVSATGNDDIASRLVHKEKRREERKKQKVQKRREKQKVQKRRDASKQVMAETMDIDNAVAKQARRQEAKVGVQTDLVIAQLDYMETDSGGERGVSRGTSELPDPYTLLHNTRNVRNSARLLVAENSDPPAHGSISIFEAEQSGFEKGAKKTPRGSSRMDRAQGGDISDNIVEDAFEFANAFLNEPTHQRPSSGECSHGIIPSYVFYQTDPPRPKTRPPPSLPPHWDDVNPNTLADTKWHSSDRVNAHAKRGADSVAGSSQGFSKRPRTAQASNSLPTPARSSSPGQFKIARVNQAEKDKTLASARPSERTMLETTPSKKARKRAVPVASPPNTTKTGGRLAYVSDEESPSPRSRESSEGFEKTSESEGGSSFASGLSHDPGHRQRTNKQAKSNSSYEAKSACSEGNPTEIRGENGMGSSQPVQPSCSKTLQITCAREQRSGPNTCPSKATAQAPNTPKGYQKSIYRRHGTEPVRSPQLTSPAAAVKRAAARPSTLASFIPTGTTLSQPHEPSPTVDEADAMQERRPLPPNMAAKKRKYKKRLSAKEQQSRNRKFDRSVVHNQRASDEELVRIGRYPHPYIRHSAAPYAFRYNGKLFADYRYLANKTDASGEGWSDRMRKTLTSK